MNERYLETLDEQADLRGRAYGAMEEAEEFPPLDTDAIAATVADHAADFDGTLVFLGASDFGHPAAFVPEATDDPSALLNRLLDEFHRERGKWQGEHDGLREVRAAAFETEPNLHKGLAALVTGDGVEYDLGRGFGEEYNFVTIRQVVGLVDWLANSYQADGLTVRY